MTAKCAMKILVFFFLVHGSNAEKTFDDALPVITPNFTQLAKKAGLPCEEVEIITEDGYILTMFHIPGDLNHSVITLSGNLGTCDDFMTRGKTSLPYILWCNGYDIWMANNRGCRYGRRHTSLNPDKDDAFWNFYLQEFAVYDMTAMIDYILARTPAKTLSSIGWSCGTTVNYILGAERPEYNKKIDVVISLAPICYLDHSKTFSAINVFAPILKEATYLLDMNEILGENSTALTVIRRTCSTPASASHCLDVGFYPVVGNDAEQVEPDFAPVVLQHYPSGSSRQNELHLSQIVSSKKFAKYDYGPEKNLIKYGCKEPKEYDLSKVTMNVVLISGKNDKASTLKDVDRLKCKLPNVDQIILKPEKFNHLDFVCGRDTHKILYKPIILEILKKYNNKC